MEISKGVFFLFFLYIEPFVCSYKDRSELAILSNTDGIQSINKVYYILFHSILAEPSVDNSFGWDEKAMRLKLSRWEIVKFP